MSAETQEPAVGKSGGLRIAIGIALILAIAIIAGLALSNSGPPTPSGREVPSARAIDYSITPLHVAPNPDGRISVEAEVVRKDSSNWDSVSVDRIHITGATNAAATLVSPLPTAPIPERFVLKFLCDANAEASSHLQFTLTIKASKYLGLSGGSSQRSTSIRLDPMEAVSD
jgi:hypothetical protein